jgi:hypothetical protein
MSASETEFLNGALGMIKEARIQGIDDNKLQANWCKTYWPPMREAMLRSSRWNFAEARAKLQQVLPTPAFEFAFSYALPARHLCIREYNGHLLQITGDPQYWMGYVGHYKIEGKNRLLSSEAEVRIVYTQDIDNPALFDPLFYQLAQTALASRLARAIKADVRLAESLMTEAMNLWLPFASSVDGQEGPPERTIVDDLLWGR